MLGHSRAVENGLPPCLMYVCVCVYVRGAHCPVDQYLLSSTCTVLSSTVRVRGPQIPVSEFPSFLGPLLGPVWRHTQIPDSEFPSFRMSFRGRPPLHGSEPKGPRPNSRITPSFRPTNSLIPVRARPSSVCIGSQRVTCTRCGAVLVGFCFDNEGFLHLHRPVPVSLGRANTLINDSECNTT